MTLFWKIIDTNLIKMYGFVDSYCRLHFHVITSSFVHFIPINNRRLLVCSSFVLHNCELSRALWASCFAEELGVMEADSTGAGCSGAQAAGRWARLQIAKIAKGRVPHL